MPNAYLNKWRSDELTRGIGIRARTRSSGVIGASVTALTNDASKLNTAIDTILTAQGGTGEDRYHPADTDLPMAAVSVRHHGGTNAIGSISYRHVMSQVDLTRSAKSQADRTGGSWSFRWWRDTTVQDGAGRPAGPFTFHPYADGLPEAHRRPLAWTWKSGIMYITLTTILDNRPDIGWADYAYYTNTNADAQWLTVGAFPAKSLLFLPYTDQYIDGRYLVQWRVAYNPHKWQYYSDPVCSGGSWSDSLVDAFPSRTFYAVPVHA